jgi:hypothetical protein
MERLLPAHCGHKKASGNNGCKKEASNNWPTMASASGLADGINVRPAARPLARQNADSRRREMARLAAARWRLEPHAMLGI